MFEEINEYLDEAIELISNGEVKKARSVIAYAKLKIQEIKWVCFDEILPEPKKDVLVFSPYGNGYYDVLHYDPPDGAHYFGWYPGGSSTEGTYWMPIPEFSKGEQHVG